jgi:polyisoprenoid-binding protein YceI
VTDASEFGYRVDEVLAGVNSTAVGRGNDITGLLTIDGTTATGIEVAIDVATISSDDGRRDGRFRGQIMETDQFPTATFSLTSPTDFGAIPDEGEQVTATATGDLTLHGVTREVTFELTAEATADRIGVLGSIPVLFADHDIDNPSFGSVKTEDDGLLEFVLVFERP